MGSWDCYAKWIGNRSGRITAILDGDTIEVEGCKVRLSLVDAPEMGSPGAEDARNFLVEIIPVGTSVLVDQDRGQPFDAYGRIVAVVYKNGINVNEELLEKGKATLFKKHCGVSEFGKSEWAMRYGCEAETIQEPRTESKTMTSEISTEASKTSTIQGSSTKSEKTTSSEPTTQTARGYRGCYIPL